MALAAYALVLVGIVTGFLTPILAFTLYQAGQGWLANREAQELAANYPDADPDAFVSARKDFAEELTRIFEDLPTGEVQVPSSLRYRGCEGTYHQASRYDVILRITDFDDTSELHDVIDAVDNRLEDAAEWSLVNQEPRHNGMGGWETWFYEWEHAGATLTMDLEAQ